MQRIRSITRLLFALVLFLGWHAAHAQEVLLNDGDYPHRPLPHKANVHPQPLAKTVGTTAIAPMPFVDDFSYDSLFPARTHWDLPGFGVVGGQHVPGVSTRKGMGTHTKGVCSFDGATAAGDLYEDELAFGLADSLTSLPFDFSTFSPADSLYLTFYVQRGGRNDAPEAADSLVLYFDSTGTYQYEQVWSLKGSGVSDAEFRFVEVPVRAARYFSNGFRFRFVNFGSLNGEFDVFHLESVVLRANRFSGDSATSDVSPYLVIQGPLGQVSAVPRDHFGLSTRMDTAVVAIGNLSTPGMVASLSVQISDPRGGNTLSGTTTLGYGANSIPARQSLTAQLPGTFSEQAVSFPTYGAIRMRSIVSAAGDQRRANDTLDFYCDVDSTLGYDDGVADAAYGLTSARSFCQEYRIPAPDTLTAVWIYFTPYLYYNNTNGQSFSLANKNFRLSAWDTLVVDSFLVQTSNGMAVVYDSSLNSFNRYPLPNPVVVDTLFWVGLRQIDGIPLGVGFDRNFGSSPIYYESLNGNFVPSTNVGNLMIRPEFGHRRLVVSTQAPMTVAGPRLQAFPHPWRSGDMTLRIEGAEGAKGLRVRIHDLSGRLLYDQAWPTGSPTMTLPEELRARLEGLSMLQVSGQGKGGISLMHTQRLLVQSAD